MDLRSILFPIYLVASGKRIYGGSTRAREGDTWSKPVNLGPDINTPGDELFPYFREDGTLYFSSDGLIGMGGLDIFNGTPQPDGSWVVKNMKSPINSFCR